MSKLNILCGEKIMGWNLSDPESPWPPGWNPEESLYDALVCLERAVGVDKWNCGKWSNGDNKVKYYCEIHRSPSEGAYGETLALAMCRAALRAMGVPESEIQEAMK